MEEVEQKPSQPTIHLEKNKDVPIGQLNNEQENMLTKLLEENN